jgi:LytS/YehU family sensor histidine kinase
VTWEGNLRLYLRFQNRTDWLTRPWKRVRLLLGLVCLFTVPFVSQALWGWALVTGDSSATWRSVATAVLVTVAVVIYITHVYETVFLLRDWETERLRGERLQREKIEAELDALKSEVDPHTLFNNLNALSHLVEQGSPQAVGFVQALAAAYRYLLRSRRQRLVTLAEELALLDHFLTLVSLRQAGGLKVDVAVPSDTARKWALPPISLPELLENAVKHNELTPESPLRVVVRLEGDRLVVSSQVRPRTTPPSSMGVGLQNLSERFRLITGLPVRTAVIDGLFVVTLPLVAASREAAASA